MNAEDGDLILFSADTKKVVADVLGNLRLKIGRELGLIDDMCTSSHGSLTSRSLATMKKRSGMCGHHPFTRPRDEDIHYFDEDPSKIRAQAYDLVLNGYEVGGGSMRIYKREIQEKMFKALGFSMEEAYDKFGFLLDAFEYGTPPHGGIAFGFDRLVMLLAGRKNLRDTIAFPKTANATDLLCDAPSEVSDKQLEELSIRVALRPPASK